MGMNLIICLAIGVVVIYSMVCMLEAGKRMTPDEWDKWLDEQQGRKGKDGESE